MYFIAFAPHTRRSYRRACHPKQGLLKTDESIVGKTCLKKLPFIFELSYLFLRGDCIASRDFLILCISVGRTCQPRTMSTQKPYATFRTGNAQLEKSALIQIVSAEALQLLQRTTPKKQKSSLQTDISKPSVKIE